MADLKKKFLQRPTWQEASINVLQQFNYDMQHTVYMEADVRIYLLLLSCY